MRNEKVAAFRISLISLIFDRNYSPEKLSIYDKVSYQKMLFSLKPLVLESFFTSEEIKILKS